MEEIFSEYERLLETLDNMTEEEDKYLKTLYYKYKCIKTNQEIYLRLYTGNTAIGMSFRCYVGNDPAINFFLTKYTSKIYGNGNNYADNNNNNGKITKNGYFKGKKLCGKVQVVDSFPDFNVQVVNSLPDLKVQKVQYCPNLIGEWQFVNNFPDFTIQYVNSFPDFTIKFVDYFPGVC
jgi:hypothetical protein